MRFLPGLLFLTISACEGQSAPAAIAAKPAPAAAPAATSPAVGALPIAQYLGQDDVTGGRIFELLRNAGIKSSAGGSLGYSVWVEGDDRVRAKARQILIGAAASECLQVAVFDDRGVPVPGTQPARCAPPAPPPRIRSSKK